MKRKQVAKLLLVDPDAVDIARWREVEAEVTRDGDFLRAYVNGAEFLVVEEFKAEGPPRGSRLIVLAQRPMDAREQQINDAYRKLKGAIFLGPVLIARLNNRRKLVSPFTCGRDTCADAETVRGWLTAETTVKSWMDIYTNEAVAECVDGRGEYAEPVNSASDQDA